MIKKTVWAFPKGRLLGLLAISMVISLLKASRFVVLLKQSRVPINFIQVVRIYLAGQAATPLPGGEAVRALMIKHDTGASFSKTSGPIISQAYIEPASALIVLLIGSLFLKVLILPVISLTLVFIAVIIILTNQKLLKLISDRLTKKSKLYSFTKKLKYAQGGIKKSLFNEKLVLIFMISFLSNIFGGILFHLITTSFDQNLSIFKSIFVYASSVVIGGVDITPGGIGLIEGGMVGILSLFDIPLYPALTIVLIFRVTTLIFYLLTGLILTSIFYGKKVLLIKH